MIINRIKSRYQRMAALYFAKRTLKMQNASPLISFTFDDFPRSALLEGGKTLNEFGATGTYYTSFGLMGQVAPTGQIFRRTDLAQILDGGHELGCHTYDHCHATETRAGDFERSITKNREALADLVPQARFDSLSYPIGVPRPSTKRLMHRYFRACRAGGQNLNAGELDLNYVNAFFLERCGEDMSSIRRLIDDCCARKAWLVFATHDIAENHTRYGCRPNFFQDVVAYSARSGASIVPVSRALSTIGA